MALVVCYLPDAINEKEKIVDIPFWIFHYFRELFSAIICSASPYFQDLLSQQHLADTHITIILSDVSFEHLRALVEFIYKGKVSVSRSQLPDLLESATSMKIKGLADTIKCSQQQCDPSETQQPESEGTLLKVFPAKSIAQMMPSQNEQPMTWNNNDVVVVKEELDYDSDANVVYKREENNWMSEGVAAGSVVNEPHRVSLSNSSTTESPGTKSDRSSYKRKKKQHHSSSGTNIPTRPSTLFNRKSSLINEEGRSSGSRN